MAILPPPAPLSLRNAKWRLNESVQVNRSGWTGTSRIVGQPGAAFWTVEGDFTVFRGEAAVKAWRAWLLSLRGPVASFPVRACETAQTYFATANIAAAAMTATSFTLANLPGSATVLKAGDMLTVTLPSGFKRLVMLTSALVSDQYGNAVAQFVPELGETPAGGAVVDVQWPYALMRLTAEPQGWDVDVGQLYQLTLKAEEAR